MFEIGDRVFCKGINKVGTIESFYRGEGGWCASIHFDGDPENLQFGKSLQRLIKVMEESYVR